MALKELRGATRGWIFKVFVALLIASFGAWGVQDIFKGGSGGGVAKVGGDWISTADFQERLRTAADRAGREQGKPINLEQAIALHLPARVLDQMINERALDAYVSKLNLTTHDDTLSRVIREMPAFQGADGRFNQDTYRDLLSENHLTRVGFESEMRADIARSQLQTALMHGATMPRGLLENLLAFRGEMREVSYVLLDPSLAGAIPEPDKPTLEKLINADKGAYSTRELRSFVALVFRPTDFADRVQVPDSEVMDQYKFHQAEYKVPEQRIAREMSFPTEGEAREAMTALQAHTKTFEAIGKARGLKDDALTLRPLARKDIPDPVVADAVYDTKTPGLIGPINGTLAWAIAEVKEITPERAKTYDEMKDEIRKGLAKTRAEDLIYETVNKFEDARAGGSTFEEIAKTLNVPLVKYDAVDAQGQDRNGKAVVTGPNAQDLLKAAFAAEQGTDSDTQSLTEGGQFVVRLDTVAPPALRPYAEIEAQARAAYEARERATRLKAKADSLVAAHPGDGLGAIASELGVPAATLPEPLRRSAESEVLAPDLVEALFLAKPHTLVVGDAVQPGKMVIASVMKVDRPSAPELAQGVQQVGPQVDNAIGQDVAEAFVNAARSKLGAKTNQKVLDQAASSTRF